MSASHFSVLSAVVFQLVATLERYEQDVDALLSHWPDTERYETVRRHMDELQMFSSSVPSVAVSAVALLIAHSDLMFTLWRADPVQSPHDESLQRARASHRECVAALRRVGLRELSRGEQATAH